MDDQNHYPLTTSIIVFPIRGKDFLLKRQDHNLGINRSVKLSGFYHKSKKVNINIRSMACDFLHNEGVETQPSSLKLIGIMDTAEDIPKDKEEHMFVYTCSEIIDLSEDTIWTSFVNDEAILFENTTRRILSSIARNQPIPSILENNARRLIYTH